MLMLAAPSAGASELLRQAYDELFYMRPGPVPVYFSWSAADRSPGRAALRFWHMFLAQLVAYRRQEPELCHTFLTVQELVELAPQADSAWLENYRKTIEQARQSNDETELTRLCLSAPQRAKQHGVNICILFDHLHAADWLSNGVALSAEILKQITQAEAPAVLCGYRRRLMVLAQQSVDSLESVEVLKFGPLPAADAKDLLEHLAGEIQLPLNSECRDLLVEITDGSPLFLRFLAQAAKASALPLTSFKNCGEVFARELMGGATSRYLGQVWDGFLPDAAAGRQLLTLLCAKSKSAERKAPIEYWRKRLNLDENHLCRLLRQLHARELAVVNHSSVELAEKSDVWDGYLALRHRLEIEGTPRALVKSLTVAEFLKRAPALMSHLYRSANVLPLRGTLGKFDGQNVPQSLFHPQRYAELYQDLEPEELPGALQGETTFITLPQVINVATSASYKPAMQLVGPEESCVLGHGFTAGRYTDEDEFVWIAAQIEAKNAAGKGLVKIWHEGLKDFASSLGLAPAQLWLISRSGFTAEAKAYLAANEIHGSDAGQFAYLCELLEGNEVKPAPETQLFELTIPMSDESELVAASALEQIARRLQLPNQTVNQIKTALVEACINASEHSYSPERRIHQQFQVEPDKLTITVSSRGLAQTHLGQQAFSPDKNGNLDTPDRRGWGLKLIRTLMDEVEFERVDDGTRLRMAKSITKTTNPPDN
jgi:serine/threonine-protein kinase RsbW